MPRTLRFHLDEHCPTALAEALRRRGIDVTTTSEAGLREAPDEEHLTYGRSHSRVINTNDPDFLRLASSGVQRSGIVFCHSQSRSLGEITRMLVLRWEVAEPQEMENQVEFT